MKVNRPLLLNKQYIRTSLSQNIVRHELALVWDSDPKTNK